MVLRFTFEFRMEALLGFKSAILEMSNAGSVLVLMTAVEQQTTEGVGKGVDVISFVMSMLTSEGASVV